MITELERRLSDAFHADAQRAHLANPDAPTESPSSPLSGNRSQANRRRWLLAVAAATTLVVVAGVAMIQNARGGSPAPSGPTESVPVPSVAPTAPVPTAPRPAQSVTVPDGTVPPVAMPEVVADLSVAQPGTGRIWVGTDPNRDGRGLGLAYSDDGGATWSEVALPEPVHSTILHPNTSADPDLLIAADGDRVAVTAWWGPAGKRAVYVSDDAGRSWTTATPSEPMEGNVAHMFVLADGRLALMWSMDAHPRQMFVSNGSQWGVLESVAGDVIDSEQALRLEGLQRQPRWEPTGSTIDP